MYLTYITDYKWHPTASTNSDLILRSSQACAVLAGTTEIAGYGSGHIVDPIYNSLRRATW